MFEIYTRFPVYLWPIGPALLIWALLNFRRILSNERKWPRLTAVVDSCQLDRYYARGWGTFYWPKVKIHYFAAGRNYTATFQWDAGINDVYALETLSQFPKNGVISIQYAPYDPSIVRTRSGKLNNEAWTKYIAIGSVGALLSILTLLAVIGNLP